MIVKTFLLWAGKDLYLPNRHYLWKQRRFHSDSRWKNSAARINDFFSPDTDTCNSPVSFIQYKLNRNENSK